MEARNVSTACLVVMVVDVLARFAFKNLFRGNLGTKAVLDGRFILPS
jgi:hypothetical protein